MTDTAGPTGFEAIEDEDLLDPVEDPDGDDENVSTTYNPEDPASFNG